ncbi:MAG: hypothetical protein IT190_02070 [Microbacteriaceae bacterium]|nr:hypothetical protein [Microbacteriaceae bacterium]
MELGDPSAAECLRFLLEEQARQLRISALRIESLCRSGGQATQPVYWAGPARTAHDAVVQRLISSLATAHDAAAHAAEESARAVATLSGRVG